jgi:formate hydrogenlyase subunit 3/multisubunit Na+/H+ antiporter MnhD subunit
LTKTHVEAPSGFSIYLSGFLVKSALFGFYKITTNLNLNFDSIIFIVLCFFSVFDASLKM